MSTHTKEPWSYKFVEDGGYDTLADAFYILDSEDNMLFVLDYYEHHHDWICKEASKENLEANAKRIVACVNACKEISTKDLENEDFISLICRYCVENANHKQQRDKLLERLKRVDYELDKHKEWRGMSYNPLPIHPIFYKKIIKKNEELIAECEK